MPIRKGAVEEWLARPLRNLAKYKQLSSKELDKRIAKFEPPVKFHTKPFHHQKLGFYLSCKYDSLLFFWGLGLGKSKATIDILSDKLRVKAIRRALILVPTQTLCQGWLDEAKIHGPKLKIEVLGEGHKDRKKQALGKCEVLVATYQGWLSLMSEVKNNSKGKGKKKNGWVISRFAHKLASQFDFVVYDEISALKNHRSLYFRMSRVLGKYCRFKLGLSGTLFGRNSLDLWAEFHALDGGASFGTTIGLFREACFTAEPGYFGGVTYTLKKKREPDIRRFMRHTALRYDSAECVDLPKQIYQTIKLHLPKDTQAYYEEKLKELRAAVGDVTAMKNAFCALRQISSGYITAYDAKGNRVFHDFDENPKLEATEAFIRQVPEGRKMVIFHSYVHSGGILQDTVKRICKETDCLFARIYGKTKDKAAQLLKFQKNPDCRFFILNDQSGALGLNLQCANYVWYYESSVSPIVREQSEKRCHRIGSKLPVYYYDPIVIGTVDQKIASFLAEGRNLFDSLIRNRVKL